MRPCEHRLYTYAAAALVNIKRLKDLKIYTRHTETARSGKIAFNAYINITITLLLFLLSICEGSEFMLIRI